MKTKTHITQLARLLLLAVFLFAATAHSTVVFDEHWQGLAPGDSAFDSGRWELRQGVEDQFDIVEYPASSGDLFLSPSYSETGAHVLPMMRTVDSFSLDTVNELSVTFTLTGGSGGYFRFGIQAPDTSGLTLNSYYFHVTPTQILLNRGNASGPDTQNVFGSPTAISLTNNTYYTLTLQVVPQGGSTYGLKMLLNGVEIISGTDTAGPSFGEDVQIFAGFRDPKLGRVEQITFSTLGYLYWTADGSILGGEGTWDTDGANWSASETSVSGAAWNGAKTAVFTNSAATVTVDEVTVEKGILFATTGYTLEDGTITLGGADIDENTITANTNVTATINSVLDGADGFTKAGAGTLVLGGDNTFSGGAAISAGTLELKTDTGSALGNATSLTVGTSATLLLSKSGQVNNSAAVTLSGGTIERANGVSETFGNLNLTEASFLDYGTGDTGTLTFGTYTPSSLLTVNNFLEGNVLVFSSNLSSSINNTNNFKFDNGFEYHWDSGASTFTITAIPEPSAYVAAAGLIGLMLWPLRRRAKRA